jgi:hypothetical protein
MSTVMELLCQEHDLLICQDGVVRIPFLVKGELLLPPEVEKREIEAAFSDCGDEITYAKLPNAQVLRETVIDRNTMKPTFEYIYQLLPILEPYELIETDIEKLSQGPYSLSLGDILSYLKLISDQLSQNQETVKRVQEICRKTSEHPDIVIWSRSPTGPRYDRPRALDLGNTRQSVPGRLGRNTLRHHHRVGPLDCSSWTW